MWRNAPMRVPVEGQEAHGAVLQRRVVAVHQVALRAQHCYMYRAVKRVLERQAAHVLYRGKARQTLPPIQEWRRFDADVQPGLFWCEDLAAGESPKRRRSTRRRWCEGRSTGASA